jgi:NAD(P)-dependent dehydrogenase (short-subunit alcohol dehydrogenase family)
MMAIALSNKVFDVTGGASEVGLATVNKLLANGASVGVSDVNEAASAKVKRGLKESGKGRLITGTVDVKDQSAL